MIGRIFSRIFISHDISSIEFNDPRIFFLGPMFDFSKDAWREKGSACRFQSPELEPEPGSRFLGWSGSGVCLATGLRIEVRAGSRPDRPRSTCEPPTNRTDDLQASGAHAPLGDSGNGTAAVPFPSPLAPYPNPVYRPWPVFRWLASLQERACYFLDLRGHSLFFPFPPPPPSPAQKKKRIDGIIKACFFSILFEFLEFLLKISEINLDKLIGDVEIPFDLYILWCRWIFVKTIGDSWGSMTGKNTGRVSNFVEERQVWERGAGIINASRSVVHMHRTSLNNRRPLLFLHTRLAAIFQLLCE